MIQKIEFPPLFPSGKINMAYYEALPIKPGPMFFKALAKSPLPFSLMKVKIPETICIFEDVSWIQFDYTTGLTSIKKDEIPL